MKRKVFFMMKKRLMLKFGILVFLFMCGNYYNGLVYGQTGDSQQSRTVQGKVTDVDGVPLSGVIISVTGASTGATSDEDGNFSVSVPETTTQLKLSYIGYKEQIVSIEGKTTVDAVLIEDVETLSDIVVVGYGAMRKKDLTGSIVQIRPDQIANENPKTVQDILRGTPGLNVGYDASAKGGGSMQIRGQRSVYTDGGHNDPLIILDGMMFYGELSEINPDDIGQIDILKDASAAAVYGAKAANGVIIIVTKKGARGKPVVNVSTNVGFTTKSAYREVFGAEAYMQYREDWYKTPTYGLNTGTGKYEAYQSNKTDQPGYYDRPGNLSRYNVSPEAWRDYTTNVAGESDNSIYAKRLALNDVTLENYLAGRSFDWYDHTFRTGFNQDYNASVSGANDKMNYYMSVGYLNNEGAVTGNEYTAVRANMKVEGKVNKWLEIGANVNFQDRSDGDLQPGLGLDYWDANQVRNSPYASYRDSEGNLTVHPMGDGASHKGYNYDFNRQYMELEKGYTVLNSIFTAKVKLPFNITYSFNASPRYQYFYDRYFESSEHPDWLAVDHGANREQAKRFDWSLNNTLNWDYTFAGKHHVNVTLVQEAEEQRYWQDRIEARNILPSDALGLHNTKNGGKSESSFSSDDTHQSADALLARLFYAYDDRYMLTTSVRRDGYSAFGSSNPYASFPSVALAWSFTNEDFFKWETMNAGKLRVSYGKNGNRSLDDPYLSLANLGTGTGRTQGYIDASGNTAEVRYLSVDRLANPFLQWEKTTAWNLGLDYGFFNNRINGSIEYYVMDTHDMIMSQRLPGFSGFSSIATNLGEVQNRGIELSISSLNLQNEILEWRTTLGFSYNKNEIKHLYYENEDVLDNAGNVTGSKEMDDTSNGWFIGQPISAIWDYRVTGIWQTDEIDEAKKYGQKPGDPKVANNYTADDKENADGSRTPVYNDKDKEFLGQTAPPIHWSLRNDFTIFKNLSFSFAIYSYMGHKSLSGNYLNQDNGGSLITYALNTYSKEYWTPDNPTDKYGRLDAQGPAGLSSPGRLYDRSFIRLENISLGYTFPKAWTSKFDVEKLKLYGSIRNVAVWQKDWEYGDPETGGLASRIFTLGLNLTF
jgi:TonB-linked SusC/RagA family outer membrane protein